MDKNCQLEGKWRPLLPPPLCDREDKQNTFCRQTFEANSYSIVNYTQANGAQASRFFKNP